MLLLTFKLKKAKVLPRAGLLLFKMSQAMPDEL